MSQLQRAALNVLVWSAVLGVSVFFWFNFWKLMEML